MNAFSQWLSETCHHEPMNQQKRSFFPQNSVKGEGLQQTSTRRLSLRHLENETLRTCFLKKVMFFFFNGLFAGVHLWGKLTC